MKEYTVHVDIDLPRERVIELFDNPENMVCWQDGLLEQTPISGIPGQPGAKSILIYKQGKNRMELTQTVTKRNLPDEFDGTYEWKGGRNTLRNKFIELAPDKTRFESVCAYEFSSPMLKLMGLVMPGMFRKGNLKFLNAFKAFCEHGTDIRTAKSK